MKAMTLCVAFIILGIMIYWFVIARPSVQIFIVFAIIIVGLLVWLCFYFEGL